MRDVDFVTGASTWPDSVSREIRVTNRAENHGVAASTWPDSVSREIVEASHALDLEREASTWPDSVSREISEREKRAQPTRPSLQRGPTR